jgi:hypothetical protein
MNGTKLGGHAVRTTTVVCDRCACVIDARVVALDVLGGTLPRLRDRVDLCEPCSQAFAEWLAGGKAPEAEPSIKLSRGRVQP